MNTFYEEYIGFEPILPTEIVDLLNRHKAMINQSCKNYAVAGEKVNSPLDEHELAMAE